MEPSSLSKLIDALEHGTKIHISVIFYHNYGNRFTRRTRSQMVHDSPVCRAAKATQNGLAECIRCRRVTEKMVCQHRKSIDGFCVKGVYEYCRPIIYEDQLVGIIFIGNILTPDPRQRRRLLKHIDPSLLASMEQNYTREDCIRTADALQSYITFLFEKHGNDDGKYDPWAENMKSYIREHMYYDVSLTELAEVFNYNEKYLGHRFKTRTGYSVKRYSNMVRVKQAKQMLTETKLSISNIAQQLGFSNVTYFDRVFREFTGACPRAFRMAAEKGQP